VKIFRYLDKAGSMGFGRFDEQGQMYLILKKDNGDFEATDQRITPFRFLTPIDFRCIYGIGLNYKEHAKETGKEAPKYPMVFIKAPTCSQSAGDPIVIPRYLRSDKVDYEGELGVVIGKPCKNVKPEDAYPMFLAIPVLMISVPETGKRKKEEVSFAGVKVLIPFVRLGPA